MSYPRVLFVLAAMVLAAAAPAATAQDWPGVYDPLQLLALNLDMDNADWQTIQNDETFSIEVPAMFWADGETPILVGVRRKSALPIHNGTSFDKVALKIDINELVPGQLWRSLRKLSLENGDCEDVVKEGVAWYLHRIASGPEGYGYDAGLASWVTLTINETYTGVYLSAEQRDKRFLQNRGLWFVGSSWLYKVSSPNQASLEFGGPGDSPTFTALCYEPFAPRPSCATPDNAMFAAELPLLVDMNGILTLGGINAFATNPDAIFSAGKNFFFADFLFGPTRQHYPWDLDSVLGGGAINSSVYTLGSDFSTILLNVPEFRALYSQILNDLICGPFAQEELHPFLDALELVLTDALDADPNNQFEGTAAEHFDSVRDWISQRLAVVAGQIEGFVPCGKNKPCPSDLDGSGSVGTADLLLLLAVWGSDPGGPPDFDGDGNVATSDLLQLLGDWGDCP